MASKRRWVWVSRDDWPDGAVEVHLGHAKPHMDADGFYYGYLEFCRKKFEQFTGLHLEPGECVKVEFSAKRVK